MNAPTPEQVSDLRIRTGLSPETLAGMVYASRATWYRWESYGGMPAASWELLALKLDLATAKGAHR